jgi:hypothetical protein
MLPFFGLLLPIGTADVNAGIMAVRMLETVWSDAASDRSPKAMWHKMYVAAASITCFSSSSRTVADDPAMQKP